MAIHVKQLYESVKQQKIELIAGANGLGRGVRWVHMVESAAISSFLEGGEITFTTGVGLQSEDALYDLVKNVVSTGASAVVINIGPYIQKIDSAVIAFCEERQIPLFSVAWEVHMAEIMRQFCLMITLADKRQLEISSAVRNAILFPKQKELYVPHLENHGLCVNTPYTVMILQENVQKDGVQKAVLLHQIENYMMQMEWDSTVLEMEPHILVLFSGEAYTQEMLRSCYEGLVANCTQLRKGEFQVGIGRPTSNMYCIHKSFKQAKSVIDLNRLNQSEVLFYSDIGIYKLLGSLEDRDAMRSYVEDTIGRILQYDALNDNNLTEVLQVYLRHNGSVKETAEELYVHRNTINYKIRRIGELLGCSLMDYEVCCELNVALKLHKIMKIDMGHLQ